MSRDDARKGRRLSEEETKLWRGVVKSVAPLRKRAAAAAPKTDDHPSSPRKPAPKKSVRPPAPLIAQPKPPAPPSPPPLAPLDRKTKSRIARGTHAIDARLDLHGHTQAEAHDALIRFLRRARDKGAGVVLVITGKGGRGDGERGVLKRAVPMWLTLPEFREYVVGFDAAAIGHGGEGALYVRVRKKRAVIS
jgi:DNA-nicking Smr family endonuclease